MPMVPETFGPSVAQDATPMTPATGPWVSPMRNHAPGLLQQTGDTLARAGAEASQLGNTIGDRVEETVNAARTQAAQTKFLQTAMPLVERYKATEGDDATQQFQPTAEAIVKARADQRAELTNPIQQRAYDLATNDHVMTFAQQMSSHENTQRIQFGKQQSGDGADNMNAMSRMAFLDGKPDEARKYAQLADDYTLNVARLSGADANSPVAQAMLRVKRGGLARGVVAGLLERHAVSEADDYFARVQPDIDERTAEMLDSALKGAHSKEDPKISGEQAIQTTLGMKGPGVLQPPMPGSTIATTVGRDGVDLHATAGTKVFAPASGTVTKVWTSPELGLAMQISLPNGYATTLSGLAAANYEEGQKITQGQVLGLSGRDDSGRGVTHYAVTGPDGKYIDPRQASSAPMDPKNFNTPGQEEKAIEWVNANVADPDTRKLTEGYVRSIGNTNRQLLNQEHASAVKQATDWWFQHGSLDNLPGDVKMQLTPTDLAGFTAGQEKTKNDQKLLTDWIEHPANQTVDAVKQAYAQGRLTDDGYDKALREAVHIQNNPVRVQAVSIDNDQINNTLIQNGFQNLAMPGKDEDAKAQRVKLITDIRNEIDTAQTLTNKVLSRQEKQQIIDRTISDSAFVDRSHVFGAPTPEAKRVYFMTPEEMDKAYEVVGNDRVYLRDIPLRERQTIMDTLYRRKMPVTQQSIANLWVQAGKPGSKQ